MSWLYDAKKNMHVIRVFSAGIFARSPSALSGILKTPRARWRALGVFKIPSGLSGDLSEDPLEKTRITYISCGNVFWNMKIPNKKPNLLLKIVISLQYSIFHIYECLPCDPFFGIFHCIFLYSTEYSM